MASPTNAVTTLNSKGIREDLENNIYRVAPEETAFTSSLPTVKCSQHYHEWQTETLRAPSATASVYQGEDMTASAGNFTVRVGNYNQHFRQGVVVASVLENVNLAGRSSELNRQVVLAGLAVKTDIELRALGNYASANENPGTTPYQMGGAVAWMKTNAARGASGANGGFSGGVVSAATNGTTRAFSEALLKSSLNQIYTATGSQTTRSAIMSPTIKQEASAFTGLAQARRETGNKPNIIIGASDMYVSDFGTVAFIPSVFTTGRDVLIYDAETFAIGNLRGMTTVEIAKIGDADKRMVVADKTLVVRNEARGGVIADLT